MKIYVKASTKVGAPESIITQLDKCCIDDDSIQIIEEDWSDISYELKQRLKNDLRKASKDMYDDSAAYAVADTVEAIKHELYPAQY